MKAYKAFNHDWTCRGFQYEIGKTYVHSGPVELCDSGFHACEAPLDVLGYYPPTANFAEVELDSVSAARAADSKRAARVITVKAALPLSGLIAAQIEWVARHADGKNTASGDYSTAASSGNGSKAASSGDYSTAASSGDYSTAASSGNGSTAASSGDYSKAASSGNGSTAASSGDGSKAASSGEHTLAMVAGLHGKAKAGQFGAFALPWLDGEQIRIAVGIIGEGGIQADTWYRVGEAGKLIETKE